MTSPQLDVWTESVGTVPHKVTVSEYLPRERTLYLWWRRDGNWKTESLNNAAIDAGYPDAKLVDAKGNRLPARQLAKKQAWAKEQAELKYARLKAGLPDREQKLAAPLTLGETWGILIDKDTGKYPEDSAHRREVKRELESAIRILGADMPWSAFKADHFSKLRRTRIRELQKDGHDGIRGAEITLARIAAIATWLRDSEKIPADSYRLPKKWKTALREDWQTVTKNNRLPEPRRPRYTRDEALKILAAAASVDPRLNLLLALGLELRGGQVVRVFRSDLNLEKNSLRVHGAGKKQGTLVMLTKGQRAAVDSALHPETGYLRELEAAYQAKSIDDYTLIPAGQFRGIRVHRRGRPSEAKFESWKPPEHPFVPLNRHASLHPASPTAMRKWFRLAEERAGIAHVKGRGLYGGRRAGVDYVKANKGSREVLQSWGGWADTQTPDAIYADQEMEYAAVGASELRAKFRGEEA